MTQTWRPLWEAAPHAFDALRRVIMAGYNSEGPHVGEAFWGSQDGRGARWIWRDGGDVLTPLGFQDLPDFPVAAQNNKHVVGRETLQDIQS